MSETLHLRMSSMQHTDTAKQAREDAEGAIPSTTGRAKQPDFIGFTELAGSTLKAVQDRCRETGYVLHRHGSVGIAVHPRQDILEKGHVSVLPALRSPSGRGSYRARSIVEVTARTPGGVRATVHLAHWITDARSNERRDDKRTEQSEAMVERVRLHGRGERISFWMGDTNSDEAKPRDEVQKALTRGHLVSIYDELKKYPSTHGKKTIDVIGHYDRDGRVRATKLHVGKKRNSDHRVVDATYEIRNRVMR